MHQCSWQNKKEDGAYLKEFKERVNSSPVYQFLGMKVARLAVGSSRLELNSREDLRNIQRTIHGGIIVTLLDSSCGVALGTCLEPGDSLVTLDLRIN